MIAVNDDQPNSRWYSGTGIYRPVYLYVGKKKHIPVNGVKIRTVSVKPAVIEVEVRTSVPGEVKVEILDDTNGAASVALAAESVQKQKTVKKNVLQPGRFSVWKFLEARLWSCDTPNLYTCRAIFGEDTVMETFGIRLLKWDSQNGMTINNRRVILRGPASIMTMAFWGPVHFLEAEERRVRILKENGYNAIRSSHYPCSRAMLDACDRQGMLMMDEYVDVWYIHKTKI